MDSLSDFLLSNMTASPLKKLFVTIVVLLSAISHHTSAHAGNYYLPWYTVVNMHAGEQRTNNDWPTNMLDHDGLSLTIPFKMLKPKHSALAIAIDAYKTHQDDGADFRYEAKEYYLGIRHIKNYDWFNLYWGGGPALIHANVEISSPSLSISGKDDALGYWIGGGIDFRNKSFGEGIVTLGLFARYSNAELSELGISGGGLSAGFSVGFAVVSTVNRMDYLSALE